MWGFILCLAMAGLVLFLGSAYLAVSVTGIPDENTTIEELAWTSLVATMFAWGVMAGLVLIILSQILFIWKSVTLVLRGPWAHKSSPIFQKRMCE